MKATGFLLEALVGQELEQGLGVLHLGQTGNRAVKELFEGHRFGCGVWGRVPGIAGLLDELVHVFDRAAVLEFLRVVLQSRLQLGQGVAVLLDGAGQLGRGIAQPPEGLARAFDLGHAFGGQVVGKRSFAG